MTPANTEGGAPAWLVLPTYNEASNLEAIVDAIRDELVPAPHPLSSTTPRPDGTGEIADRLAAAHRTSRCSTGRARRASARPTSPGFRRGARGRRRPDRPDGRRLLPRSRRPAPPARRRRATPTWCSARATCTAAASRTGARFGGLISRGGCAYARAVLGLRVRDLTGGFKVFRREVLEAIDLGSISAFGYAFQVETTYRAIRAGFRVVELPIVFRDRRRRRVEDEQADRAGGGVAGARDAPARLPGRR